MYEYLLKPENIPNINKIKKMDMKEGKGVVSYLKKNYTNAELRNYLNISSYSLYKLFDYFGVEYSLKKKTNQPKIKTSLNNDVVTNTNQKDDGTERELLATIDILKTQIEELKNNDKPVNESGFTIIIKDTLNKEELSNKLLGIVEILNADKKYDIDFVLRER